MEETMPSSKSAEADTFTCKLLRLPFLAAYTQRCQPTFCPKSPRKMVWRLCRHAYFIIDRIDHIVKSSAAQLALKESHLDLRYA